MEIKLIAKTKEKRAKDFYILITKFSTAYHYGIYPKQNAMIPGNYDGIKKILDENKVDYEEI